MIKLKYFLLGLLLVSCSSPEKKEAQEEALIKAQNSQQVQAQETSQIPPVSRIEWKMCNITVLIRTPCTEPPTLSYHWGEVKEIKIFKVKGLGDDEFVQAFVKSQGCFEYYSKPQAIGWYPISGTANEIKEKKASAEIVSSSVLNKKTLDALLYFRSSGVVGKECNALPEKNS